jgi:putative transposase|tara:strand:- start:83 stop:514 length:432 start_codon:yes stop_codon:yes gene_type:complete
MEFVNIELEHYNHKVGINFWHLTWQTKYRYGMFAKFKYKSLCEASIRKAAKRHKIQIHIIFVMPDHVHMIATLPKGMSDEKAFQLLKGCSSYTFFKNHTKARLRYPQGHLWSRGGTAVTVGYNQLSDTVKYILEQAKHHGIAC